MTTPPTPDATAIRTVLQRLAQRADLGTSEIQDAFRLIMRGEADHTEIGALLMALSDRGESSEVLVGIVQAMREVMLPVRFPANQLAVDTCGTGGGAIRTLNISTAAAFLVAGAGIPVAKHGNRSFTSRSGSADVLEALGIATDTGPDSAARVLSQAGIVFLFAPTFHPAMRHLAAIRRSLAVTTVMNLVGPLANPAGVQRQVIGVADPAVAPSIASALRGLGCVRGMVVHGEIGIDEISPVGLTHVWDVDGGGITVAVIDPETLGLATPNLGGTEGGSPEANAAAIERLLNNPSAAPRALRSAVILNAAAAILVSGTVTDFARAAQQAMAALDEGKAAERLSALRAAAPLRTSG
ncbi:MAG: anthranilate phosphoribosyltransferase [Gemmatimonadota bacterium]